MTDPDVPPQPPHITLKQAKAMISAIAKRDPDTTGIVKQSIKGVTDELLPHRER